MCKLQRQLARHGRADLGSPERRAMASAHRPGPAESPRNLGGAHPGQRSERAQAGPRHQQPTARIRSDLTPHGLVEEGGPLAQRPRSGQRGGGRTITASSGASTGRASIQRPERRPLGIVPVGLVAPRPERASGVARAQTDHLAPRPVPITNGRGRERARRPAETGLAARTTPGSSARPRQGSSGRSPARCAGRPHPRGRWRVCAANLSSSIGGHPRLRCFSSPDSRPGSRHPGPNHGRHDRPRVHRCCTGHLGGPWGPGDLDAGMSAPAPRLPDRRHRRPAAGA